MQNFKFVWLSLTVFILGCSTMPAFMDRSTLADHIAAKAGFSKEYIKAGDFSLMTFQRFKGNDDRIRIYIEGDGRAWETKYQISVDPTPSNPVALRLAAEDPAQNTAYIARPGQYSISGFSECNSKYWSEAKYAPEVINSFNRAIDRLKEKSLAHHVDLVGFSGGAAIVILVAANRRDVSSIRTVAGNLNPTALCQYHQVSPLEGSMDPMKAAFQMAPIAQRHFCGSKDLIVPEFIAQSFVYQEGDRNFGRITIVQGVTHTHGWQSRWKYLLSLTPGR